MQCVKCSQVISNVSESVKCVKCLGCFHPACCRVRTVAKLNRLIASGTPWSCDTCKERSGSETEEETMVDLLKSIQVQLAKSNEDNKASFNKMELSIASVHEAIAGVRLKMEAVEQENVKLKEECRKLVVANEKMSQRIEDIQWDVLELEQRSKLQNLEIRGIPYTGGEDIYLVLEQLARALGVEYNRADFSVAHRLPSPRNARYPPAIIAQFISRSTRGQWLSAAKGKSIYTTDISATFTKGPIFINEHLSRHNKDLLLRAKAEVRRGKLAFAWAKDGKVLVRRTKESRVQRIFWSLGELDKESNQEGEETQGQQQEAAVIPTP